MIARLRIVMVDPLKGKTRAAYIGEDPVESAQVYEAESADPDNEAVRLYVYPQHARISFPAHDIAITQGHQKDAREAVKAIEAAADKKTAEASAPAAETENAGTGEKKASKKPKK